MDIFIERKSPSGYLLLSTIINDHYYKQLYDGYTIPQAKAHFKDYVQKEESKIFYNQD